MSGLVIIPRLYARSFDFNRLHRAPPRFGRQLGGLRRLKYAEFFPPDGARLDVVGGLNTPCPRAGEAKRAPKRSSPNDWGQLAGRFLEDVVCAVPTLAQWKDIFSGSREAANICPEPNVAIPQGPGRASNFLGGARDALAKAFGFRVCTFDTHRR